MTRGKEIGERRVGGKGETGKGNDVEGKRTNKRVKGNEGRRKAVGEGKEEKGKED